MKKRVCFLSCLLVLLVSCSKEKKVNEAALKMQDFIGHIATYARSVDPDFIIIPQNGAELAFTETDPGLGICEPLLSAVDGWGVEELFYNNGRLEDDGRLGMLQALKPRIKIMVSDYCADAGQLSDAVQLNASQGFICFPRGATNYHYQEIPTVSLNWNTDTIRRLEDAKNYLYLISTDHFTSKPEMISAISATNFDLVLIDLFFNEEILTPADVAALKTKANGGGRLAIAYLNIGAAESWRYYWQSDWKLHQPDWLKKKYEGYDDEIWVEFWEQPWQDIIYGNDNSYIKKILDAGFDGAYLDNTEAYYFLSKYMTKL